MKQSIILKNIVELLEANHKPSKSYGIAVIVILILGFIAVLIVH